MDNFIQFELVKLFDTWKKSRNNKYSNTDIQVYHDYFREFYKKLRDLAPNIDSLDLTQKQFLRFYIEYFQNRINCLSNNTSTNAPYELTETLKAVASEWIPDIDKYIILTHFGDYSFSVFPKEDILFKTIESDYGIADTQKRTILLSIPHRYYRDYLNNVVLFHEIGHFVDNALSISRKLLENEFLSNYQYNGFGKGIKEYFRFLETKNPTDIIDYKNSVIIDENTFSRLLSYWKEYFADIFAASYVGNTLYRYLDYHTFPIQDCDKDHDCHPSNQLRARVTNDFLSENSNYIVDTIQNALNAICKKTLPKFNNVLNPEDLYKLLPLDLQTDRELYSLFATAWDIWYGDRSEFTRQNNLVEDLNPSQLYSILNNLVEKSISNYLIQKKWNDVPK